MIVLDNNDFPLKEKTAVAVGLFDGVHAGHVALINDIKQHSEPGAIYTFDLKPSARRLIFTPDEKKSIFSSLMGEKDYYFEKGFDADFMALKPEEFLKLLVDNFNPSHLTVGFDFRFGKNAVGDTALLEKYAEKYDYILSIIPEVRVDGFKVSSSKIRQTITSGDMTETAELLGHFYFVDGSVQTGKQLGRTIGFPTANISTQKLLPPYGVYASYVRVNGKLRKAVTNIGINPTVKSDDRVVIESFIIDFDSDIYGDEIRVYFVEKLRDEKRFSSIETLKKQMVVDAAASAKKLSDFSVYMKYII